MPDLVYTDGGDAQPTKRPHFNFAQDIVDGWATRNPDLPALRWLSQDLTVDRTYSYGHFSRQSQRAAVLLRRLGLEKGDRALIMLPRIPEWWEITCALMRLGVVVCPTTTLARESDIAWRLKALQAKAFIGSSAHIAIAMGIKEQVPSLSLLLQAGGAKLEGAVSYSEEMEMMPQDAHVASIAHKADDDCFIYFTSGTTGLPKMVLHSQVSYPLAHYSTGKHWLGLKPGSLYWNLSELGWAKAAWAFFGAWHCGATLFVVDDRRGFDAQEMLRILHTMPIQTLCAPPTVFRQLMTSENRKLVMAKPPLALQDCIAAGEPLNGPVIEAWKQSTGGVSIRDGYGQSETVLLCGNFKGHEVKPGSMGKPAPGVKLAIVDEQGTELPVNEEGNLAVLYNDEEPRGFFGLFKGYIDVHGKVTRPILAALDGRRWYVTGDRALHDEDGYFWFIGRSDDIITSSGYRIGPFEVESTLKQHPGIVESAVVASPDPERVEIVKAYVVLTAEYERWPDKDKLTREIQDFCKKAAAPYKYPRKIEFVKQDFLPKTVSGKVQRSILKKREFRNPQGKL